jgi:hypothetical protein
MPSPRMRIARIAWGDPRFQAAKNAEFQIFGVANGFVNERDLAAGEMLIYHPYEKSTEFYALSDDSEGSSGYIGIVRFIRFDPDRGSDSFSTLKDARSYSVAGEAPARYLDDAWDSFFCSADPASIAELATQAVVPGFRRRGAVEHMWNALMDVSEKEGVVFWTMALILPLFRWYKAVFPNAVHSIGRVMPQYVGADSVPAVIRIDHPEVKEYQWRFLDGRWSDCGGRRSSYSLAHGVGEGT